MPFSVQRKKLAEAQTLYEEVRRAMDKGNPSLLELSCEIVEGKRITILVSELLAVQMYEKAASTTGMKRPGFSFDG